MNTLEASPLLIFCLLGMILTGLVFETVQKENPIQIWRSILKQKAEGYL